MSPVHAPADPELHPTFTTVHINCGWAIDGYNRRFSFFCEKNAGVTWKESLAGDRGAMGLSVLQKWIVEGRALGVNKTGVLKTEQKKINQWAHELLQHSPGFIVSESQCLCASAWDHDSILLLMLVYHSGKGEEGVNRAASSTLAA